MTSTGIMESEASTAFAIMHPTAFTSRAASSDRSGQPIELTAVSDGLKESKIIVEVTK